jgi:hypothetical protein
MQNFHVNRATHCDFQRGLMLPESAALLDAGPFIVPCRRTGRAAHLRADTRSPEAFFAGHTWLLCIFCVAKAARVPNAPPHLRVMLGNQNVK